MSSEATMRTDIRRAKDLRVGDRVLSYDYEQEEWTVDAVIAGVDTRTERAVIYAIEPKPAATVPGAFVRWYTWDADKLLTIEFRGEDWNRRFTSGNTPAPWMQ